MKKLLRIILIYIPAGFILLSLLQVVMLKWVPVYVTPLMAVRATQGVEFQGHKWVSINNISKNMAKAVIASEDNKFLVHEGFDFEEIEKMKQLHKRYGKPVRGCSTISQQTAKNCFTFCSRTWVRKAFEAYYTVLIELFWSKSRIMEVYLNIVELGPGIYGVEAASQKYFKKPAAKLSMHDATSLACCLPNPLHRTPQWADKHMPARQRAIAGIASDISVKELF